MAKTKPKIYDSPEDDADQTIQAIPEKKEDKSAGNKIHPLAGYNKDCLLYRGDISRAGYNALTDEIERIKNKKPSVCLVLSTRGGDPDAAYRMGRSLHHYYNNIEIMIPGLCKSAGTLLAISAHEITIADRGELGPLDIQLSKPDELNESMSGLDIIQAINAIEVQALKSFRRYMVDIRSGARLRTKMSAELAAQLTEKCIGPIDRQYGNGK